MIIPEYNGRPMKILKKYKHFILFIDEKTGIRECFQYWDLKENKKELNNIPVQSETKSNKRVHSDNNLSAIIDLLKGIM